MKLHPSSKRYSKAFFNFCTKKTILELVIKDIMELKKICEKNNKLLKIISNPIIKQTSIYGLFKKILVGFNNETLNFINFLVKKKRTNLLYEISSHFIFLYGQKKGDKQVEIITAKKIDFKIQKTIVQKVIDKKIKFNISNKIDPNIIGGFILKMDDLNYDASLKRKFADLKSSIIENN
tara:strand:- start:12162 stop:12698 length:537 start_codon:yes stop_codon:yes gene_type:complete